MYLGPKGSYHKAPGPLRSKSHLVFLRELQCTCTGETSEIVVHHLLRAPTRRGMGGKSGDQHALPLTNRVHVALHDDWGDEVAFFASYGITSQVHLSEFLWKHTGDHAACIAAIAGVQS